jgi:hypothetical protein
MELLERTFRQENKIKVIQISTESGISNLENPKDHQKSLELISDFSKVAKCKANI